MADVAAACGVTRSTVSRILNDTPGFSASAAVRRKINASARKLGYQPNRMARALVAGRTGIIGIFGMWPSLIDRISGYHQIMSAAVAVIQDGGFHAAASFPHPVLGTFPVSRFHLDGALLIAPTVIQDVDDVESAGIPYVSIDGLAGGNGRAIQVDDRAAGRLAATHLLTRGHRVIAHRFPLSYAHHSTADRLAGLQDVCTPASIPLDLDTSAWLAAARQLGVTAVICYDSADAAELAGAATALAWRIPADIALIAFNDDASALVANLTVMAVPFAELGRRAASLLIAQVLGQDIPDAPLLPCTLVQRGST